MVTQIIILNACRLAIGFPALTREEIKILFGATEAKQTPKGEK